MTSSLTRWLDGLGAEELARVLEYRPETARPPAPHSLTELAERLEWPGGAGAALHTLPLPGTQLIEAILACDPPTATEVAALVGVKPEDLAQPLALLAERGLVWPDGDELRVCQPLAEAVVWPLRLGRPAADLLARTRLDDLRALASVLELSAGGQRSAVKAALTKWYADPEAIRTLVASAPAPVRGMLDTLAFSDPEVDVPGFAFGGSAERIPGPVGWAVRHGLLVVTSWQEAHLPREVALALRGPGWRPPLDLAPPPLPLVEADPVAVAREAAAAAGGALDQIAAVLAECGHTPTALLKSGGIGVREVKRLAKSSGVPAGEMPLWLELGYAAGLLGYTGDGALLPTPGYDEWLAQEPAQRLATVLRAWWRLPAPVTWPERASPPAVLTRDGYGGLFARARQVLLELAAELPPDEAVADPHRLPEALVWRLPAALLGLDPVSAQIPALWREAGLLGLVAHDAASEFGRCRRAAVPGP